MIASNRRIDTARLWRRQGALILLPFFAVILIFGGSSRFEVWQSAVAFAAAILMMMVLAVFARPEGLRLDRGAAWLMLAVVAAGLVQLIPLPQALWTALPGRAHAAEVARAVGVPVWLPISLAPERTMIWLLAFVPGFATFAAITQLGVRERERLMLAMIILGSVAALLGALQMAEGPASALRFYAITDTSSAVGFFANPNHQGVLVASIVPLVGAWLARRLTARGPLPIPAIGTALLLVALALAGALLTKSRAAVLFSGIAVVVVALLLPLERLREGQGTRRGNRLGAILMVGFAVAVVLAIPLILYFAPQSDETLETSRLALIPRFVSIIGETLPLGAGFGSFDLVYRLHETIEQLSGVYLNQAHNEVAQLIIEGGVIALALLIAFLWWWGWRARAAWRARGEGDASGGRLRAAAAAASALFLLHGLVDYPLRTPAGAAWFAALCALMLAAPEREARRS